MTTIDLLKIAEQRGLRITARGQTQVCVYGPRQALDELAGDIEAHVPEIVALLRENEPVARDSTDAWDERLRAWIVRSAEGIITERCAQCGGRHEPGVTCNR